MQESVSDSTCDLHTVIRGALRIAVESTYRSSVALIFDGVPENCHVQMNTAVIGQVILMIVMALEQVIVSGEIVLEVEVTSSTAKVTFRASPTPDKVNIDLDFARELVVSQDGTLILSKTINSLLVTLRLPRIEHVSGRYTVLVVDDNADLVTLYASYCIDTDYDVIHVDHGNLLFHTFEAMQPDVIFLDILLPDVNGWQLLIDLHNTTATRDIPVVMCSVITDVQMALKLGASLCLRKPVSRQQFLDALNHTLKPLPT